MLNYQDKNSIKKLGDCYQNIVELLCSYHKIKFVYQQAQLSYQAALKASQEIEEEITQFVVYVADKKKNLDKLGEMLDKLPLLALKHSAYCGELELSLTTIEINHQNYKNYLQKLLSEGSQLDSWQKFSDHTRDIFIKQIQCWLNYMSPRKELGQQLTASIRGIVEIEQVKSDRALELTEKERDRNLQTVITVVGVGIGVAGVTATAFPYYLKPPDSPAKIQLFPWNSSPHPVTKSISISLVVGLLASVGVWGVIQLWKISKLYIDNFKSKSN